MHPKNFSLRGTDLPCGAARTAAVEARNPRRPIICHLAEVKMSSYLIKPS
jgi:hypothetical protein